MSPFFYIPRIIFIIAMVFFMSSYQSSFVPFMKKENYELLNTCFTRIFGGIKKYIKTTLFRKAWFM